MDFIKLSNSDKFNELASKFSNLDSYHGTVFSVYGTNIRIEKPLFNIIKH